MTSMEVTLKTCNTIPTAKLQNVPVHKKATDTAIANTLIKKLFCRSVLRNINGTLRLTPIPHTLTMKKSTLTICALPTSNRAFSGSMDSNTARDVVQTKKNPANGR
jgi:hypothetical protein